MFQLQNLVREVAASEIMPYFLRVSHSRKEDGSVLSQADIMAQNALAKKLPEIIAAPVLGEEMSREEQRHLWQAADSGLWVIDPIDGTNNFVNGIPHFAVSVAFVREGQAQLGVVYNPCSDECFHAELGGGAWLNDVALPLRRVPKKLHETVAGVDVKRLRSAKLVSSINYFAPFGTLRCLGSSTLDWCYLAAGRYDVYLHGGQNLWDYAAGALILTESGGCLTTLEGDDFWSGLHTFKRSAVAAGQVALFDKWVNWVRKNQ